MNLNKQTSKFFQKESKDLLAKFASEKNPRKKKQIQKQLLSLSNRINYEINILKKIIDEEENS